MQKPSLCAVACCLVAIASAAQNPRAPQRIDGSSTHSFDPVVASSGDRSLVAWVTAVGVFVSRSDGAGLSWSAPVRVDADTSAADKDMNDGDLQIAGGSAYVVWKDERHGSSNDEVYFNYSNDGGATWMAEQRIDKTLPPGFGTVRDWRLAVEGGSPDRVHVLLSVDPTLSANEVLVLVSSFDGGATFQTPSVVPQGVSAGAFDVDNCEIVASGGALFVTWVDDRNGEDDVFFQKSTDSGATWLPNDVQLDSSNGGNAEGVPELAVNGNVVAVAWAEERPNNAPDSFWANVSTDGGATFVGDRRVGSYPANVADIDNQQIGVTGSGNVIAAWDDNRFGIDETFVATSSDGGASWQPDVQVSSNGGEFPRIATTAGPTAVVLWTGGAFPENALAVLSHDGGATWLPPVSVSANIGDADSAEGTFNDLYNNFVSAYLSDDLGTNRVYAGGFRPQTVTNVGWGTNDPTMYFEFSGFGNDTLAAVGLSQGAAPVPIPGGPRVLYLTPSPFFVSTMGSPLFQATLTNGAGSTQPIPNFFAGATVGWTLYYAAIGVGPVGGIDLLTDTGSFNL